ncbi:MAG: cytochrome-c peroxidase [Deinococcales bacterium]|nr:cytochrome-c peroxidase [Chitinophagaceae bacterium]
MKKIPITILGICTAIIVTISCSKQDVAIVESTAAITSAFGTNINFNSLANYANQGKPNYIVKDNIGTNAISNAKATVGRVLFYDKNLSVDNTISCSSCHKQAFAFGDTAIVSKGVAGGITARHSMRLVNARFSTEVKFFWDERAATLEQQTTKPIQDHAEMGFSGLNNRPTITTLLGKLQGIGYYNELFKFTYGDITITETRLQECLSQFVRSIQSFDSKYDVGRTQANNDIQNFVNFSAQENAGKILFVTNPIFDAVGNRISGGLGCNRCHNAPEFDIDPNSRNNGIVGIIGNTGIDVTITRAPTLRDLLNNAGVENGPMMHTGNLSTLQATIGHYNTINLAAGNNNLDPRLVINGQGQKLNLTAQDVNSVVAFLKTLSGNNIYTDTKWGNPFK